MKLQSLVLVFLLALSGIGCENLKPDQVSQHNLILENPYESSGGWIKDNFHMHSMHSDGRHDARTVVELYKSQGYKALCITDHNMYGNQDGGILVRHQTDAELHDWNGDGVVHRDSIFASGVESFVRHWSRPPENWNSDQWYRPMGTSIDSIPLMIAGVEASYSYFGAHFCLVGRPPGAFPAPSAGFGWLKTGPQDNVFKFIAHPGLANQIAERFESAVPIESFHAIEIINGLFMAEGSHYDARPLWDELLTRGHRLWGIANDDFHRNTNQVAGPFTAFSFVKIQEATQEAVIQALISGAFYSSTGLEFSRLDVQEATISVCANNASTIRFIGTHGALLKMVQSECGEYEVSSEEGYVRVEAIGPPVEFAETSWNQSAWSQPFFIQTNVP